MSVLYKALQRAEKTRSDSRADHAGAGQTVGPGAPGSGGSAGAAPVRSSLSMGRRIGRLAGVVFIVLLAATGAALYLIGDDIELLLADSLSEAPITPVQPSRPSTPPQRPAPAPVTVAPETVATEVPDTDGAPTETAPPPQAATPADEDLSITTDIARLMEAGRTGKDAPESPQEAKAEAAPPEPRSLGDVLDAETRLKAAAPLKPTVLVNRPGGPTAKTPDAEVEVTIQSPAVRDGITVAYQALMRGDYHMALETYDSVLESEPASLPALLGRAAALHKLRRLDEAQRAYETVLGREPSNREALTNLADILSVAAPQDALARLADLHRRAPDFGPVTAQLALLQARLGHADQALALMTRAAALEPGNALYRYNLAVLQDKAGDRQAAAASYRRVLEAVGAGASVGVPSEAIRERLRFLTAPAR